MVVRLHLEHRTEAVTNIDRASIFPRSPVQLAARSSGSFFRWMRELVGTVLAPHWWRTHTPARSSWVFTSENAENFFYSPRSAYAARVMAGVTTKASYVYTHAQG